MWLLATGAIAAQIDVSVRVDRNRVAVGESLQMRVTIEGGEGDVNVEAIADFKVFSRGTSTSMQFINGRTSRQVTHNYTLIPQKEGTLTIPALPVAVDGRTYHTQPITVTVTSAQAEAPDGGGREVWVTAEVSAQDAFVGQQLIYTFSLHQAVEVRDAKLGPPEFEGFEARELEQRDTQRKIVNGREQIITQVRYVLIPRQAGTLTIEPANLQVGVVRPDRRQRRSNGFDSFFNDPFFTRGVVEQRLLQTKALVIQAKPLPDYNGKPPFSGLVGRFDLSAGIERNKLQVGDSTTLTITLEGQGNIPDAPSPELNIPPAFKTYADTPEDQIQLTPEGYKGRKIFRVAVVPVDPGKFTLTPASLVYFDLDEQAYITLNSAPMELWVVQGESAQAMPLTITPTPSGQSKQTVDFTGRDILPVKEGLDALANRRPLSMAVFGLWLFGPLLPYLGVVLAQRARRKDESPALRMRAKARTALKHAMKAGSDREALLGHLYQALTAAIFSAAARNGEALTWKEAQTLLMACGQSEEVARQTAELLARIESAKFGGVGLDADQREAMAKETRAAVRKLAP